MDEKTRRMDTLRGIQQAYGEYAAARGKARAFEPVKPAVDGTVPAVLRDWALARMRGEVAVQLPADRAEQQNSEAEAKLLRRRTEDLHTRLDMIRGQMQGLDGGNLTRLELELDQARRTLEDCKPTEHESNKRSHPSARRCPATNRPGTNAALTP